MTVGPESGRNAACASWPTTKTSPDDSRDQEAAMVGDAVCSINFPVANNCHALSRNVKGILLWSADVASRSHAAHLSDTLRPKNKRQP